MKKGYEKIDLKYVRVGDRMTGNRGGWPTVTGIVVLLARDGPILRVESVENVSGVGWQGCDLDYAEKGYWQIDRIRS